MQLLLESAGRGKATRPHTPETRGLLRLLLGLSVVGLLLSVYLLYGHYAGYHAALCELGRRVSCGALRDYSALHGVPVAFLGIEWFAVMLLVCWTALSEQHPLLHGMLVAWNALGVAAALGLILVEIAAGVMCPFCTLVHLTTFATAYLSVRILQRTEPRPSLLALGRHLAAYPQVLGSFLLLNAFVLGLFNLHADAASGPDWWDLPAQTALVACLQQRQATLYGDKACSHCHRQRKLFLPAAGTVSFVDCSLPAEQPRCKDIVDYPTWTIGAKRHAGLLSLEKLAEFAECSIPHRPKGS